MALVLWEGHEFQPACSAEAPSEVDGEVEGCQ